MCVCVCVGIYTCASSMMTQLVCLALRNVCGRERVCERESVCVCVFVYVHVCVCVCVCLCVRIYTHAQARR